MKFIYKSLLAGKPLSPSSPKKKQKKSTARKVLISVGIFFGALFLFAVIYLVGLLAELPDVRTIENLHIAQSTVIYDKNGGELYKIHGEENRKYIPLSDISDLLKKATIATEDKDFYHHAGFDLLGIVRSVLYNVTHPTERARSGSTITQQLVKMLFLTPEVNLRRKLKELILAYQVEQTYSKDKILELYLNQIPYGSNAYGAELAAQTYFGKKASELTLIEAAILASLPNGPSVYSPYGSNRARLMGECKLDTDSSTNEFSATKNQTTSFTVTVKAKATVYVKSNIDEGTKREELTLKKGEEKEYTATASLGFLLGNRNNVDITYEKLVLKTPAANSFVLTPETIRDFLAQPELLDKQLLELEQQRKQSNCTSMDDPNYVSGRKDLVLTRMLEEGYITADEMNQAWLMGQKIQFKKYTEEIKYPHFVMYVKDYLENKYGQEIVEKGGLQVKTTLDPRLQDLGQSLIDQNIDRLEKQYKMSNMALLSADPKTGQILAMIGSRDYWNEKYDGNVNIATSYRQPGSSFKPFTYAAAFDKGYGAGTVLWDVKTPFGQGTPPNNADGTFLGPLTIRKALAWSRNIPAIKGYFLAGEEDTFLDFLGNLGFDYLKTVRDTARQTSPDYSYGWPMAIGSVEVRMLDMVQGYAIFANGGMKKELTPILEIRDKDGNILEQYSDDAGKKQVLDPQIAYLINNILSDKDARPGGYWRDRITVPNQFVAAKTGTSNKRISKSLILPSDNWTMGYSTSLVTGMWGGNSDGSAMAGSAFDVNTIASLWKNYMTEALKDVPPQDFPIPEGIVHLTVNSLSGKRVSKDTPDNFRVTDIFPSFGVPAEYDDTVQKVQVDSRNNLLATADCAPSLVEDRYVLNPHEVIARPGWDEAIRAWVSNSQSEMFGNILVNLPQQPSPLCQPIGEDQKPSITILSPLSFGQVTKGTVNVFVQTSAFFGIDRVEYFLDEATAPVSASKQRPYTGFVTLNDVENGSVHTIRAIIYDRNGYSSEANVEVKVTDTDTSPPHIAILTPQEGTDLPLNSSVALNVEAYDDNSAISKVDFFLDGTLLATVKNSPYVLNQTFSSSKWSAGSHTLFAKAQDAHGNSASATITFNLVPKSDTSDTFEILEPTNGVTLSKGQTQKIQFVMKGKNAASVDVIAHRSDGTSDVLQSLNDISDANETFVIYWTPNNSGTYQLFLKATGKDGSLSYSNRVQVTVQ